MSVYIGLMSGTSLDGIDAAAVEINNQGFKLLGARSQPIPDDLKQDIETLTQPNGADIVDLLGQTDARLGNLFATSVKQLLSELDLNPDQITAIGSHGQTIRHRPDLEHAFTLQIGDASRIAEQCGITTITDFRRRDIAAGGQGAPLVPAFHRAAFGSANEDRCIINIGGMANISFLPANAQHTTSGFDTGPGNILLDSWCRHKTAQGFDKNGEWGRSGKLNHSLFSKMLEDMYFSTPPPKSTGREYFNLEWIQSFEPDKLPAEDIQNCLTELTARTIIDAITEHFPSSQRLVLCGGGCHNQFLSERIEKLSENRKVETSADHGLSPDWVEAAAFAWLAHCTLNKIPANVPAVTGAHSAVILGAIYPA